MGKSPYKAYLIQKWSPSLSLCGFDEWQLDFSYQPLGAKKCFHVWWVGEYLPFHLNSWNLIECGGKDYSFQGKHITHCGKQECLSFGQIVTCFAQMKMPLTK
jgi:hypothetical protein